MSQDIKIKGERYLKSKRTKEIKKARESDT